MPPSFNLTAPRFLLNSLLAALLLTAALRAQDGPGEVAARVTVTVNHVDIVRTGRFTMRFRFVPEKDLSTPYSIRVLLVASGRDFLRRDHHPETPTVAWRKGEAVEYEVSTQFPLGVDTFGASELDLFVGFFDPARKKVLPPIDCVDYHADLGHAGVMSIPDFSAETEDALLERTLNAARELAKEGRKPDAWSALETGMRLSAEDRIKLAIRDAMLGLGRFPIRGISPIEQGIVDRRIAAERRRYLRLIAGRLYDRGSYHGALRIIEAIGGKLAEQSRTAVIGALNDAERTERDRQDTKQRLLDSISEDQKTKARDEMESLGSTRKLYDRALGHVKKGEYAIARMQLRDLRFAGDEKLKDEAFRKLNEIEKEWVESTPPDQQAAVDAALNHSAWGRTKSVATMNFILIGPETLIENVDSKSSTRFDLAYVFITDLFGRVPNPGGDRVTVYFKELWDFGGGVGGGKTIDIGRADRETASWLPDGHRPPLPRADPLRGRHDARSSPATARGSPISWARSYAYEMPSARARELAARIRHVTLKALPRGLPGPRPGVLANPELRTQRRVLPALRDDLLLEKGVAATGDRIGASFANTDQRPCATAGRPRSAAPWLTIWCVPSALRHLTT